MQKEKEVMRDKILIVDDVEINRELLAEILNDKYDILQAENGVQALKVLKKHHKHIALLMLDLFMPEMDGFEVLNELNKFQWIKDIAIIIISSDDAVTTEAECFELGVSDFVHKPFDSYLVKKRVDNIVSLFHHQQELERRVEFQTNTLREQYKKLQLQAEQLLQSKENVIDVLGTIVEYRNLESGKHIERVKGLTKILAEQIKEDYPEYGLTDEQVDVIVSASALHDIGKISIPDSILLKPGKLTSEEFENMKLHTVKGAEILKGIRNVWNEEYERESYNICRYHHERYDGKGYPDGLKGDEIPISAQIVAVADVYDALVNKRVYKSAYPKDKAFKMIMDGECGVFSPKILKCLCKVRHKFEKLADGCGC